jgi:hypothetical protein
MTRKDYILLAKAAQVAFKAIDNVFEKESFERRGDATNGAGAVVDAICDALQADNYRFNREHFCAVVRGEKDLNSRPGRS